MGIFQSRTKASNDAKLIARCVCGARLVRRAARQCYTGTGVYCDNCWILVEGNKPVYHCPEEKKHPAHSRGGWDLCTKCAALTVSKTRWGDSVCINGKQVPIEPGMSDAFVTSMVSHLKHLFPDVELTMSAIRPETASAIVSLNHNMHREDSHPFTNALIRFVIDAGMGPIMACFRIYVYGQYNRQVPGRMTLQLTRAQLCEGFALSERMFPEQLLHHLNSNFHAYHRQLDSLEGCKHDPSEPCCVDFFREMMENSEIDIKCLMFHLHENANRVANEITGVAARQMGLKPPEQEAEDPDELNAHTTEGEGMSSAVTEPSADSNEIKANGDGVGEDVEVAQLVFTSIDELRATMKLTALRFADSVIRPFYDTWLAEHPFKCRNDPEHNNFVYDGSDFYVQEEPAETAGTGQTDARSV